MRFIQVITFLCISIGLVSAAPAPAAIDNALEIREASIADVIASLDDYKVKRSYMDPVELDDRAYSIVTEVLTYINSTGYAPEIIEALADDTDLQPIITKTIIAVIKSGAIDLTTLLEALNQSGLTVQVIDSVINDCQFYATIYKIALSYISNLASEIASKLKRREVYLYEVERAVAPVEKRVNSVVLNLLESLKESGLAPQVVDALVTDPAFLKYGASLISQLFNQGLINLSDVVNAVIESGTLQLFFEQILTFQNLKNAVVNALAAAEGKCGSTTSTMSDITVTSATSKPTSTGGGSVCRKRKRSY